MDIIAHFLWTFAIFFKNKKRLVAGFFGVMPDIVSFGPHLVLSLIVSGFVFGKPDAASIPGSVHFLYSLTHSLIIFIFVMLLSYVIAKKVYWVMFGWGLHILIDIPSHSKDFFPTPFLWPISYYTVSGVSWGNRWFMIINYGLLAIVYSYLLLSTKKGLNKNKLSK